MRAVSNSRVAPLTRDAYREGGHEPEPAPEKSSPPPLPPDEVVVDNQPSWGTPVQIAAARAALHDLLTRSAPLGRGTLLERVNALVERHRSNSASDVDILNAVRRLCEQYWRRPVISTFVLQRLFNRDLFAAWKTLDLLRLNRSPTDVTEEFVRASGNVGQHELVARDVFWQRFRPLSLAQGGAPSSGRVFLIAPGLGETGRNFYEEIAQLNRLGHDVVVMDQQWAGQTRNADGRATPGELDGGFGAARDVARVAEHVHRFLCRSSDAHLVLLGQGSGAAAILMLLVLRRAKMLEVALPQEIDAFLQAPYLAPTPNPTNRLIGFLGRMPGGRHLPAGMLLPNPAPDTDGAKKFAQCRRRDNVTVRLGAVHALRRDMQATWDLMRRGYKPAGRLVILHSADDPWADPAASHRFKAMGRNVKVRILRGAHHAIAHGEKEREEVLWGLQKLSSSESSPSTARPHPPGSAL